MIYNKKKKVTPEIGNTIECLWKEDAIKLIYDLRAKTKIYDSCAYFWNEIKRISSNDYVPNEKDILLRYDKSTGKIFIYMFIINLFINILIDNKVLLITHLVIMNLMVDFMYLMLLEQNQQGQNGLIVINVLML